MSRNDFVKRVYGIAKSIVQEEGRDLWIARWMTAVACLETGYGEHIPDGSNNIVGYHCLPGHGWDCVEATEGGTGKRQKYRVFQSWQDCLKRGLFYSIVEATGFNYGKAREDYDLCMEIASHLQNKTHAMEIQMDARYWWIEDWAASWCGSNENYASNVISIMQKIEQEKLTD